MTRHHHPDEVIQILAEAMSGQWEVKDVARRHGINPSTLHRWKARFPRAPEAYALFKARRHFEYMNLLAQMETPGVATEASEEMVPEEFVPELPAGFLEWEAQQQKEADTTAYEASTWKADNQPIHWEPGVRWDPRLVAKVHGNLPREDDIKMQISLPKAMHSRLTNQKDGSLNRVITGLIGYALETLDEEGATLHIYDRRKPKPVIKEPRVVRIAGLQAKEKFEAKRRRGVDTD